MEWTKITRENLKDVLSVKYRQLALARMFDWGLEELTQSPWEIGWTPSSMADSGKFYYRVIYK